jgi:hypothetical protein
MAPGFSFNSLQKENPEKQCPHIRRNQILRPSEDRRLDFVVLLKLRHGIHRIRAPNLRDVEEPERSLAEVFLRWNILKN